MSSTHTDTHFRIIEPIYFIAHNDRGTKKKHNIKNLLLLSHEMIVVCLVFAYNLSSCYSSNVECIVYVEANKRKERMNEWTCTRERKRRIERAKKLRITYKNEKMTHQVIEVYTQLFSGHIYAKRKEMRHFCWALFLSAFQLNWFWYFHFSFEVALNRAYCTTHFHSLFVVLRAYCTFHTKTYAIFQYILSVLFAKL